MNGRLISIHHLSGGGRVNTNAATFDIDKNPNHSKACGRSARVTAGGKSVNVRVVDRCGDCPQHNIDLSPTAFQQLAPLSEWDMQSCENKRLR